MTYKGKVMTILFYEPSSGFGGSGNALYNLLRHIDNKHIEAVVVTCEDGPQFEKIKALGIKVMKANAKGPLNVWYLLWTIKKLRINLVHINTNIISGIPAIIAAKIAGIPCICHIRQTRKLIRRERFFAKWADSFIVLNKDAYELLSKDIPQDKLQIVYDGIDFNETFGVALGNFKKEYGIESSPTIGLVGRIVEGKGHKEFILASTEVLRVIPEAKFVIVGDAPPGDGRYCEEVKELAEKEDVARNIVFTGWRNDIPEVASSFDIAVQPYTSPEGLPNTIMEEMAMGKPVITTNIAGASDIVIDNETGCLVPPGDYRALASAILRLLADPELSKQMGSAGRRRVREYFDITKTAKKIEELYDKTLSSH